jgi:hypothetical protein
MLEFIYILHVTLLILHEIESGYEKEWEILRLPGRITGFLLLHIPIIFIFSMVLRHYYVSSSKRNSSYFNRNNRFYSIFST